MRCNVILGPETLHEFWRRVSWSMNICYEGVHPPGDQDGQPWPENSYAATVCGKPLGLKEGSPLLGAMCLVRGDWAFLVQVFMLKQYYRAKKVCHLCAASADPESGMCYTDFSANPVWGSSMKTTDAFIAEVCPSEDSMPCDLSSLICVLCVCVFLCAMGPAMICCALLQITTNRPADVCPVLSFGLASLVPNAYLCPGYISMGVRGSVSGADRNRAVRQRSFDCFRTGL